MNAHVKKENYILEIETTTGDWASEMSYWDLYELSRFRYESNEFYIIFFKEIIMTKHTTLRFVLMNPVELSIIRKYSFGDGWERRKCKYFLMEQIF